MDIGEVEMSILRKQFEVTLDVLGREPMSESEVFEAVEGLLAAVRVAQDSGHLLQRLHVEINGVKLESQQAHWHKEK